MTRSVVIPNMTGTNKSMRDLRNLAFMKVEWFAERGLSFSLNDGQICKVGTFIEADGHWFDPAKKITRIECIIDDHEWYIFQINFYHGEERLVQAG